VSEPAPILIAGGGVGGLALALALARQQRRTQVLEQQGSIQAAGAGIQLGPNGVRILQRLGLAEALKGLAGVPEGIVVHDGCSGRVLAQLPLGEWIAHRHGAPYWVAHRADLHAVLLAAAAAEPRIHLRTGFALTDMVERSGGIEARSASGDTAKGAALVGADGLWSRVRQAVSPASQPIFAGATATRAVIPAAATGGLPASMVGLWLTPGVHVVHYPVRAGAEMALVVIMAEDWQSREWDAVADAALLLARLQAFHWRLASVLAQVRHWRRWALYRLPQLPTWSRGRLTLIGDAAHPMLPYLAQGGALALEDALVLADSLAAGEEEASFRKFEALRRPRAQRVQRASWRQGRLYHLPPPLCWARDVLLRSLSPARLMARFDWLYGWRTGSGGLERLQG
jgi:salicylate hydroxylase